MVTPSAEKDARRLREGIQELLLDIDYSREAREEDPTIWARDGEVHDIGARLTELLWGKRHIARRDHVMKCIECGGAVDRTIPNPIPEGYECMWTEAMSGGALYCRACYEEVTP